MKKLIIIFLFYAVLANAQSYSLGFDLEPHQIRISDQEGTHILGGNGLPLAIHLAFVYSPLERFSILTKIGRTFHMEFLGWEFGVSGRYNFFKSFYLSAGLMQHSNEGGSSSNSHGTVYASILILQGGIGFNLSSITSIEVNYYIPTSKKIIDWSRGFQSRDEEKDFIHTFKSMITLGFIFDWKL